MTIHATVIRVLLLVLLPLAACGKDHATKDPDTLDVLLGDTAEPEVDAPVDVGLDTLEPDIQPEVPTPSGDYFPPLTGDDWDKVDPEEAGFSLEGLEALKETVESTNSSAFTITYDGRMVVEWYFMEANADTRTDVASVQKSVTSTLVGMAREKGLLELDDRVSDYLDTGWSMAPTPDESTVTLRHLMTHSSGLDPRTLTRTTDAGREFDYNNYAYQKLHRVLAKVANLDNNALSRAWLFDMIGIGGEWVDRTDVDPMGQVQLGLKLSARDMARFGLLAMRGGVWDGKQMTPEGWFDEAWAPSEVKGDYGLLWWLQGRKPSLEGKAPRDLVSALGAMDQKIYIIPSLKLVVTRQGRAGGSASEAESDYDLILFRALAKARL
jgi:CubicO group peptidase (beta-lactamase class C family)